MKPYPIILLLLLGIVRPCFAHRLDEYLQSTKVAIEHDRIGIDLILTPGVAVLPDILKTIDADHDGLISVSEQQSYVARVRSDLSVTINDTRTSLVIGSMNFPEIERMKDGLGEIFLHFDATVSQSHRTNRLVIENRHMKPISVYLINCLIPNDPTIRITAQNRSYDQTVYSVDYEMADASAGLPTATTVSAGAQTTSISLFNGYVLHGVGHILTGYDHLLFVSALVLAATTLWDLIKVVSAFTLAHTLTLTLAAFGVIHVSPRIVEPLIAASICYIAIQNVFWPNKNRGWGRLAAVFFFGLFHGLGFAGGLLEAMRELPSGTMLLSILAFSVGVEIGHQMVVLPLFATLKAVRCMQPNLVSRTKLAMTFQRVGSTGISLAGLYYFCIAIIPGS